MWLTLQFPIHLALVDTTQVLHSKKYSKQVLQKLYNELSLLFRKDKETRRMLYGVLGFVPSNISLYKLALTHSSHTLKKQNMCNERLEYLGDAIIDAVVSDLLYSKYSKEREGFLTKSRSNLVRRETLNDVAIRLGLDELLVAHNTGRQHNNYVYGNAFEAFVGAIYLDKGYSACRRFLLNRVYGKLVNIEEIVSSDDNFKSRLIELSQKMHLAVDFRLVREENRAGGQFFESEVYVCGELCGAGSGFSKRESQQAAAKEAMRLLTPERLKELKEVKTPAVCDQGQ